MSKGDKNRTSKRNNYNDNYDKIFGKKEIDEVELDGTEESFSITNARYLTQKRLEWEEEQERLKRERDKKYE